MESQPQNPEFKKYPENFNPCCNNNSNRDLANINAYAKMCQIRSISSQDIELK